MVSPRNSVHTFIEIILYRSNMKKKDLNNATYYENLKNLFFAVFFSTKLVTVHKKASGRPLTFKSCETAVKIGALQMLLLALQQYGAPL